MFNRKVLFLLYNYPPELGTAPKRNFQLSESLGEAFDQKFIITCYKSNRKQSGYIKEIKPFDYRSIVRKYSNSGYLSERLKKNVLSRVLIKLINTFPINLIFGEGGGIYLIESFYFASKFVKQHKITHVYSSYRPVSDHFVAYMLKRRFPHLCWIADFRDLPVEPHYQQQYLPNLHKNIYSYFFKKAKVALTVSSGLANELNLYNDNIEVVMNGIEDDYLFPKPVIVSSFNIVYTGSLFLEERNPNPLFIALNNLIKKGLVDSNLIKIVYAGKDGQSWNQLTSQWQLNEITINKDLISSEESRILQQEACINLLLTMASDKLQGILTGKYIEYLKAGSPILAIVKNQNDKFLENELQELNAGISVSDQDESILTIENFILEKFQNWTSCNKNEKSSLQKDIKIKYPADQILKSLNHYL
jgi:hypothetical protein